MSGSLTTINKGGYWPGYRVKDNKLERVKVTKKRTVLTKTNSFNLDFSEAFGSDLPMGSTQELYCQFLKNSGTMNQIHCESETGLKQKFS